MRVNTKDLIQGLEKISKFVPKKSTLPILEHIKGEWHENKLKLMSTDLEMYAEITLQTFDSTEEKQEFTIMGVTKLIKKIKMFGSETSINLHQALETIKFTDDKKSTQQLTDINDKHNQFSIFNAPETEYTRQYVYTAEKLKERYNSVGFAVAKNTNNLVHQGVTFEENVMFALDGYRLAINTDNDLDVKETFVIMGTHLKSITDVLQGTLHISYSNKFIKFETNDMIIAVRRVEGEPFNYKQAIPKNVIDTIMIDKKDFTDALKYLKLSISETIKQFVVWDNTELRTRNETSSENVKVKSQLSSKFAFNVNYMLEAIQHCDTDNIQANFAGTLTPMLLTSGNVKHLVLPCRLPKGEE